ncbi:MAG: cell division protein ZapA [Bacteroidales bacterium]|nr:cell division protein ZapA [Bacteroidales bacterium]
MSESNDVKVNVVIAGRSYRLNVDKTEEDNVRRAVGMINERVEEYKRVYSDKDYLSLVSMVCIQLATTVVKNENDSAYKEQYLDKQLDTINALLTENIDLSV